MNINRNNYEAWLLDLFEGNLSSEEKAAVMLFLDNNPDLKEDFEDFEIHTLPHDDVSLSAKAKGKLKRPYINPVGNINSSNYDDFFIAFHEGTLREDEIEMLNEFIEENPDFKEEFALFGAIKLTPEEHIKFPDKNSLKKRSVIPLYSRIGVITSVAAASIALLLIFKPFTSPTVTNDNISMLQTRQFVLQSEAPELAMRSTSPTILHYEDAEPEALPELPGSTIPPTATHEVSYMSKLRPVEVNSTQERTLIPPANEYTQLMAYMKMREEMAQNGENPQEESSRSGSLFGKVIHGLSQDLGDSKKKFSFLNVLEYGVTQYHKLTNNPVTVEKEVTKEGKTSAYSVSTENFGISHRKPNEKL